MQYAAPFYFNYADAARGSPKLEPDVQDRMKRQTLRRDYAQATGAALPVVSHGGLTARELQHQFQLQQQAFQMAYLASKPSSPPPPEATPRSSPQPISDELLKHAFPTQVLAPRPMHQGVLHAAECCEALTEMEELDAMKDLSVSDMLAVMRGDRAASPPKTPSALSALSAPPPPPMPNAGVPPPLPPRRWAQGFTLPSSMA